MRKVTWEDRFRYQFDNMMASGTKALIFWLFLLSIIMILIVSLVVVLFNIGPAGGEPLNFLEAFWAGLMRTLDAGTMGADEGWFFRIPMLVITIGGIFIVSALIGILTTGLDSKLDDMRKGRSFVVEQEHTVILGWSPQIFSIISELVVANENRKRACIAILADKDKVEMEDEIREKVRDTRTTRVVCRTGSPIDLADLEIINPYQARSIIILSGEGDEADSHTLKILLAITNNPHRRPEPYHIVAEIRDPGNLEAARLIAKSEAQIILVDQLISRIIAQTCRQSGLSIVYTELLDFGGDEIYFHSEPALLGRTFGEALLAYENCALIGLRFGDGRVALNPPMDTELMQGDEVIAIAEDDDKIILSDLAMPPLDPAVLCTARPRVSLPERALLLGWNRRAPRIISELDQYVAPGSELMVVADYPEGASRIECECKNLAHLKVFFRTGNTTSRSLLDNLEVHTFDHIITIGYSDELGNQEADARTLIALLHLREIAEKSSRKITVVSEMMDSRNRELAEVTRADDFIISNKLVSLMMSQLSESLALQDVFEDLFDPEGSELYLKPVEDFVVVGQEVNFYSVVESARRQNMVAIGYRLVAKENNSANAYGVVVNPNKSQPLTFASGDSIIVLSES